MGPEDCLPIYPTPTLSTHTETTGSTETSVKQLTYKQSENPYMGSTLEEYLKKL
jgi:hypothetical protein